MKPGLMSRLAKLEEQAAPTGPVALFFMDTDRAEVERRVAEVRAAVGPYRMLVIVDIDLRDPAGGWPRRQVEPPPVGPEAGARAARLAELERELVELTGGLPN